jgi:hypothetical protein
LSVRKVSRSLRFWAQRGRQFPHNGRDEQIFTIAAAGHLPLDDIVALRAKIKNPSSQSQNEHLLRSFDDREPCSFFEPGEDSLFLSHLS